MTDNHKFDKGTIVMTPLGRGMIQYARFAPPDFEEGGAYSVLLDSRVEETKLSPFPRYNGTLFSAEDVKAIEEQ